MELKIRNGILKLITKVDEVGRRHVMYTSFFSIILTIRRMFTEPPKNTSFTYIFDALQLEIIRLQFSDLNQQFHVKITNNYLRIYRCGLECSNREIIFVTPKKLKQNNKLEL